MGSGLDPLSMKTCFKLKSVMKVKNYVVNDYDRCWYNRQNKIKVWELIGQQKNQKFLFSTAC